MTKRNNIAGENMPLVSVIMPTYNHRRWIEDAIDSVIAQTYPHYEIIVVDDGSTDETGEILRSKYKDKLIYVFQQNRGKGNARNYGLRIAKGKYVLFLDSDDMILPEKIAKQTAFLEKHPEVTVVYGRTLLFYEEDIDNTWKHGQEKFYVSGNDLLRDMIYNPFVLCTPSLVRKEWADRIGGFDERLRSNEDWDFWLRLANEGAYFQYFPEEPVAMYRQRRYNPPSTIHPQSAVVVLKKLKKDIKSRAERKELGLRRAICEARFEYAGYEALVGNKWKAIIEYFKSLPGKPSRFPLKLIYILLLPILPAKTVKYIVDRIICLKVNLINRKENSESKPMYSYKRRE